MSKKRTHRTTVLYAIGKRLLYPYYKLVYRIRVTGRENIPAEGPVLLCCNHMAKKDPVLLGVMTHRQVFYMAKEELFQNGFIGKVLRALGAFPVARGTGGTDALQNAYDLLEDNAVVGVFIEGTRSKTGELGRPKTGAALLAYQTQAPVVPACITGEGGTFSRPFHRTLINFGPAISPEALHIPDETSLSLRRASRTMMAGIAQLRGEARAYFGVPDPAPEPAPAALPETAPKEGE